MTARKPGGGLKGQAGRPSLYTDKLANEIIERLSGRGPTGKVEPLAVICRDAHMPAPSTVSDWKRAHPAFSVSFARARDDGYDALAAECLEIADDNSQDTKTVGSGDNAREVCDTEFVQRSKLRIDTRLKLLAKWDWKRYGDKPADEETGDQNVNITGGLPDDDD